MNRIIFKKLILITLIIALISPIILPIATFAESNYFSAECKNQDGKLTVTISCKEVENKTANIVLFQYVKKEEKANYFKEDNSDIIDIPISPNTSTVTTTVDSESIFYTFYVKDSDGRGFIYHFDNTSSTTTKNAPDLTVYVNDDLTANITATGIDGNIAEIKVGKRTDAYTIIDFENEGEILPITPAKEITTTYTATTNGVYDIQVKDIKGSKKTVTLILSDTPSVSIETEKSDKKIEITATGLFCKIVKLKIAKLEDIDTSKIKQEFETKGDSIAITEGKEVNAEYTCNDYGTYIIYAEDDQGNCCTKTITLSNTNEKLDEISIVIGQSGINNKLFNVSATSLNGEIIELKLAFDSNLYEGKDASWILENLNFEDLQFTQGQSVTSSFEKETDSTIYVYIYAKSSKKYGFVNIYPISKNTDNEDTQAPDITLKQDTNNLKQINVSITEDISYISKVKYAYGEQNKEYFANNGNDINISSNSKNINTNFSIDKTGIYTVYAEDSKGNGDIKTINITKIENDEDKDAPALDITKQKLENGIIRLNIKATDEKSKIDIIKAKEGSHDIEYFKTSGREIPLTKEENTATGYVDIISNGNYTIYVRDTSNNENLKKIEINEITNNTNTNVINSINTSEDNSINNTVVNNSTNNTVVNNSTNNTVVNNSTNSTVVNNTTNTVINNTTNAIGNNSNNTNIINNVNDNKNEVKDKNNAEKPINTDKEDNKKTIGEQPVVILGSNSSNTNNKSTAKKVLPNAGMKSLKILIILILIISIISAVLSYRKYKNI